MGTNIKVLSLLGNYQELYDSVKTNLLLTPEELWTIYSSLPKDLTHEDLSGLAAVKVAQAVAGHPNCSPEQVMFFLTINKGGLKSRALCHINFPQEVLNSITQEAIDSQNLNTLEKISANPNFSPEFIDQLVELPILSETYSNLIKFLCKKSFKKNHFDVLEMINLNNRNKYLLIQNKHTPKNILDQFGEQFFHEPLLYQHPNLSPVLKKKGLDYLKTHLPAIYKNIKNSVEEAA